MNTCENKLMTIFERKKFDFLAQKFKETGQIPGPNFHLSEKVQNVHITIFVKIVVFIENVLYACVKHTKWMGIFLSISLLHREKN